MEEGTIMESLISCQRILSYYEELVNSLILDFFVEDHLSKLPSSWIEHFEQISPKELGQWISSEQQTHCNKVWPLSLCCLRYLSRYLAVRRKHVTDNLSVENYFGEGKSKERFEKSNFTFHDNKKLKRLFCKHVKPKKRYEISKLARVTAEIADLCSVEFVVDIGSGLGHLCRTLAYEFNFNVCGIESQQQLIQQARIFDLQLENAARKYLPTHEEFNALVMKRPHHVQHTITSEFSPVQLQEMLVTVFGDLGKTVSVGLIGLHPCGDLAAILLHLFLRSPQVKFLNIIGCCYHKITDSQNSVDRRAFPVSEFVSKMDTSPMTYEARALGCHALEKYCDRLVTNDYHHLKVHCYRATLEVLLNKYHPEHRRSALSNVSHTPELTFKQYCEKALKKLNISIPEEEFETSQILNYLSKWKSILTYYSVRLLFGPFVESFMLFDRLLYLIENGAEGVLAPVFDPILSPRNQILLARKRQ